MAEDVAKARGITPLARIIGYEDSACAPADFGIAPARAVNKMLKGLNMNIKDIDYHEYNEAFSAVALANAQLLGLDISRVNVHGGAVALGHPVGASGARIILSLINVLR